MWKKLGVVELEWNLRSVAKMVQSWVMQGERGKAWVGPTECGGDRKMAAWVGSGWQSGSTMVSPI